jgi:pimeloyl-ACP methyl ester carboxylesterase
MVLSAQAPKRAIMLVRAVMQELRPDGYGQAVGMLGLSDIFADTAAIAVPTLVLCGSADTVTPEDGCRRIAASIPGARYEAIAGPGHSCYIEAPGPFNAALLRFLGEA